MEWPTDATMCSEFISLRVHSTCCREINSLHIVASVGHSIEYYDARNNKYKKKGLCSSYMQVPCRRHLLPAASRIFYICSRRRWVVSFVRRPLYRCRLQSRYGVAVVIETFRCYCPGHIVFFPCAGASQCYISTALWLFPIAAFEQLC